MILLCRALNQAAPGHLCREGRRGGGAPDLCVRPSISGALHKTRDEGRACLIRILRPSSLLSLVENYGIALFANAVIYRWLRCPSSPFFCGD
ncbi:hypothetical protein CDAR_117561 [Caerostris darwini]|uniref:Uncharacterized protein n=1 Tax=Caerostris darwini TaxID=1538125 RepID=A0AAV4WNJ0_9ARAC|nr:hypothetical protein CDAR_117561 [Caerostris darwini]